MPVVFNPIGEQHCLAATDLLVVHALVLRFALYLLSSIASTVSLVSN